VIVQGSRPLFLLSSSPFFLFLFPAITFLRFSSVFSLSLNLARGLGSAVSFSLKRDIFEFADLYFISHCCHCEAELPSSDAELGWHMKNASDVKRLLLVVMQNNL